MNSAVSKLREVDCSISIILCQRRANDSFGNFVIDCFQFFGRIYRKRSPVRAPTARFLKFFLSLIYFIFSFFLLSLNFFSSRYQTFQLNRSATQQTINEPQNKTEIE